MTEAGWTATVRDKARKLYGLLHAEVSRDQVCGPEDVKAIRKMEIVDIGLLIAALDDSYQQGKVAGAHDYRDAIIKELDLDNSKQQEFTRTDVILALAHADDTLAQAAQEGGVGDAEN